MMNKDNCLIYQGEYFKVEWFYDEKGYSQAYDYFLKVSAAQKRKFLVLVKKTEKLPPNEKRKALDNKKAYIERENEVL